MKRKLAVLGAMALCLSSVTLTSTAFASDTVLTTQALAEPIPVPTEELVYAEPGCYMKIVSQPNKQFVIHFRLNAADWSNWDTSNDYSMGTEQLLPNDKIIVFYNEQLISGIQP